MTQHDREQNAMSAIRDLAERTFSSGHFAVVSGHRVLAMRLHLDRATDWASFYKGAKVVTMDEALAMSRA